MQLKNVGEFLTAKKDGTSGLYKWANSIGDVQRVADILKDVSDLDDKKKISILAQMDKLKVTPSETASNLAKTALGIKDIGEASVDAADKVGNFFKAIKGGAVAHWKLLAGAGIVAAISAAITAYNSYKEKMIETASAATSSWNESKSAMQEYTSRYQELKEQLESGSLSEAETLAVKQEILSIQQQITSEYGNAVSGVDLVNGSLETQLALLQQISQEEAQTNINENRQSYQDAEKEMQEIRAYELGSLGNRRADGTYFEEVSDEIEQIVDSYEELFLYNAEYGDMSIRFTGNAEQAKEVINDFSTDIEQLKRKYGEDNSVINSILNTSSDALVKNQKNVLDKYQENYHSFLEQQMYSSGNGNLLVEYGQAISDYNNALMSGDVSKIKDAETAFNDATKAKNEFIANKGDEFNTLFDPLLETLDTATLKYIEFNEAIDGMADDDNQFKDQQKEIKQCADEVESYEMYATEALEALINGGHDASDSLWTLAQAWGGLDENSSTEEMNAFLDVLAQAGIISQDTTEQLVNLDNAIEKVNSRISVLNQLGTEGISSDKLLDAISQADETENAGDDYLKADSYLDEAKEMYDKGLIGTDDFKARATYFSPTLATDPANFIENYEKADRYLSENATGLLNFLNDLEEKNLASSDVLADGTKVWTYNIKDFDEAAQKMGISTEFLLDIFGRLEDYGFSNNFASSVEEANEKIVDKAAELANAKAKLAEMETTGQYTTLDENGNEVKTMANSTALAEQRALVQGLEQDLLQLQQTREYLASQEADNYANQVKQAKEAYATILEERNRILEENTYGEDTATVAALMEEQLRKIAEENYLSIDGELNLVNEEELEDKTVEVEVNTEGDADLTRLDEALNILTLRASDGITIKLNNTDEIDYAVNKIEQFPTDVPVDISFNVANQEQAESLSSTLDELNSKRTEDAQISYSISIANSSEAISNVDDIDNKEIDNKNYDVSFNYQENISRLNTINQKSIANKEYTVTQRQKTIVESPLKVKTSKASGTLSPALASGTAYNMLNLQPAYAGGRDVAIDKDQVALVNELPGHEGIIRNGQLYKIPGGMHYQNLKQGDIVLSASQMEQLERTGRASGKGQPIGWARSFAQGTLIQPAYASGSGGGSFGAGGSGSKSGVTSAGEKTTKANTKATQANTKATQDNTDSNENLYDWIERMVTAFERTLQRYETLLSDETNWAGLRDSLRELSISAINSQLPQYQQAYEYYMAKANSVGLPDNYKTLAENGLINIEEITDETLRQQIENFETWLTKARELDDTIVDLNIQLKELKMQKLDDIMDSTDTLTSYHQSIIDMLDASQEVLITKGEKAVESVYQSYMNQYNAQRQYYALEAARLENELDKLVDDGTIVKYSEKWAEYKSHINEAKQNLYEVNQAIAETQDTILELRWSYFEDGITVIENLKDSLSGLADLIDDTMAFVKGTSTLSGLGFAKIGLIQSQMTQAKQAIANYGQAIEDLNTLYQKGYYSESQYEEKLAELRQTQLDYASDLKKLKDSIIDLVKEGINREVDAMQELVDARQEALDKQREYYDFNEKMKDQTSEINSIEAQIQALRGNDSVEAQTKLRQLESQKRELEEELAKTQREHEQDVISQGYDDFMEEFEQNADDYMEELDSSLEAQNKAIESLLNDVSSNSETVFTYLNELANEYGLNIAENITNVWKDAQSAVEDYQKATGLVTVEPNTSVNTGAIKGETTGWQNGVYMNSDGTIATNQWISENGKEYYVGADGKKVTGTPIINGKKYVFNSNGEKQSGWQSFNGWTLYADPSDNGAVATGIREIGGKTYLFDSNGVQYTGSGTPVVNGKKYFVQNGVVKSGWQKLGNWTMYFDPTTYQAVTGKRVIDGIEHLFDSNGIMKYNSGAKYTKNGWAFIDDDENGNLALGSEAIITDNGVLMQMNSGSTVFNKDQKDFLYELSKAAISAKPLNLDSVITPAYLNNSARANTGSNETNIHYDSIIGNIEYVDKNALPELETIVKKSFDYTVKELRKQQRKL